MADQQFCLRWNNHQNTLVSVFESLLESGVLVDCTLAAEGQFLKAHKVVLSACSPFLSALLRQHYEKHPILIMKDVKFHQLKAMLDYMYRGEVNISQDQLGTFLKAAESLQIKGLSDNAQNAFVKRKSSPQPNRNSRLSKSTIEDPSTQQLSPSPVAKKRKKRHSGSEEENVAVDSESELVSEIGSSSKLSANVNSAASPMSHVSAESEVNTSVNQEQEGRKNERHQSTSSPENSSLIHPKTEYVELDEVEDLTTDSGENPAGPSQMDNTSGFPWHLDRSQADDTLFSAHESSGGNLSAQASSKSSSASPWPFPHECPICGRLYKYRSTLYRHVRYECGGARMKLVCPICGRRFSRPDNLRQHAITHTNSHGLSPQLTQSGPGSNTDVTASATNDDCKFFSVP